MTAVLAYALSGIVIFGLGLHSLFTQEHLLRKALALNFMSTGIFMFIMAMADRAPGAVADPVPHAIVLTSIVVAVCTTALLLACAGHIHARTGATLLDAREDEAAGP